MGVKRDANGTPVERERTPVPTRANTVDRQTSVPVTDDKSAVARSVEKSPVTATLPAKESKADIEMDLDEPATASDTVSQPKDSYMSDEDDDGLTETDFVLEISQVRKRREQLQSKLIDPHQHSVPISRALERIVMLSGILGIGHVLPLPDFFADPTPSPEPAPPIPAEPPARPILSRNDSNASAQAGPVRPLSPRTSTPVPDDIVMEDADEEPSAEPDEQPDVLYLPYLAAGQLTPPSESDAPITEESAKSLVMQLLNVMNDAERKRQVQLQDVFSQEYRAWRHRITDFEMVQRGPETQPVEKQIEVEMPDAPPDPNPAISTPTQAGRQHKFGSQFDLERALEESLKEEERRKEKADKENKDKEAPSEREAIIPDQLSPAEVALRKFCDVSLLRKAADALRVFEFAPPEDTLTEEQDRKLRQLYDKDVKAWHKLADAVGSTTKACINHYYATKWDNPYKSARKKKRKAEKKVANRMRVDLDPEPVDTNMGVTETGRPRRAAAPTQFIHAGKQNGGDGEGQAAAAAAAGKKTAANVANGEEKTTKRKAKEKPARKTRATLGARSAQKAKDKKSMAPPDPDDSSWAGKRESIPPEERQAELLGQPQYLPQYSSQQLPPLQHGSPQGPQHQQAFMSKPEGAPALETRPRGQSQSQRPGASSYWSVVEESTFKACLEWYGKDFNAIATHMGKKTAVMVSNWKRTYRG
jgi:serine/arginine repetitive matrix protein 2